MGFKLKETLMVIPTLEDQKTIIAEIEAEQSLINANRELANRMKKKIQASIACIWNP